MEHTKGPWKAEFESQYSGGNIYGRRKTESGEVKDYICTTSGNARANARYIVACVNQCDKLGFSAEDIEEGAIEGLAQALNRLIVLAGQMTDLDKSEVEVIEMAEAALAKVRNK